MAAVSPIAPWVRNTIMLLVCGAWAVFVVVSLVQGNPPSAIVWSVPAATYAALATTSGGRRRFRVTVEDDEDPET